MWSLLDLYVINSATNYVAGRANLQVIVAVLVVSLSVVKFRLDQLDEAILWLKGWIRMIHYIARHANMPIYISTAIAVLMACATLLDISFSYISQAIFPFTLFAFIAALCSKVLETSVPMIHSVARHANMSIYISTAIAVLMAYAALLDISFSYISLAIFPITSFAFIAALCSKELETNGTGSSAPAAAKEGDARKAMAAVPYWLLGTMGRFDQAQDGRFAVSQFLLFLSSMLAALSLMMARLAPTRVTPGVAPASELLHRASLVTLLVTVHALAAELLGDDVVLLCLPELLPVLLWLTLHLDRNTSLVTAGEIRDRHMSLLLTLGGVLMAVLAYPMDASAISRCTTTMASCAISGLLIYYLVFMLRQWPGQPATVAILSLKNTIELLQFWANVLLTAAAALVVFVLLPALLLGLHEPVIAAIDRLFNTNVIGRVLQQTG